MMNSTVLTQLTKTSLNVFYQKDIAALYQEAFILYKETQIVSWRYISMMTVSLNDTAVLQLIL